MIKKLMKKYERVELQQNINNARSKLLAGYESIMNPKQQNHATNEDLRLMSIEKQELLNEGDGVEPKNDLLEKVFKKAE